MTAPTAVTVLAGGYGGAKLSHGFSLVAGQRDLDLSVVVNTGDDLELHGLAVSPDLDTVMYTLAGLADTTMGWGVRDETWSAAAMLERYGAETWFRLGDRDLATHIRRTQRLGEGETLTSVTAELASALGVSARLLPVTDDRLRTRLRTDHGWLDFQDWFVRRHHADAALEIRFEGAPEARPTKEVLSAIEHAQLLVFAPSNPFVSIGTILAVPGVETALRCSAGPLVAVSPIVGGHALRGPADRMFESLGGEASALGVARHYTERHAGLLDALVIDLIDEDLAPAIEALGLPVLVEQTVMSTDDDRAALALAILDASLGIPSSRDTDDRDR
ncbi:MAG: 2-phospho-L-lactate transferase [Chloroflexota bacterium]|nr:2-phospho-L-lactate transferase [Chloroflexota bacterium]